MDAATLVFAVLGLVLAVVSLVWRATTRHLSGPRVGVEMRVGATDGQRIGTVPVNKDWRAAVEQLESQSMYHRLVMAKIINSGGRPPPWLATASA